MIRVAITAAALLLPSLAVAQFAPSYAHPEEAPPAREKDGQRAATAARQPKPIVLVPEITLQFGEQSAVPVASLHGQGASNHALTTWLRGQFQYRLDLNAKPGAGDPVAVAKRVRVTPGTVAANLGYLLRLSGQSSAAEAANGPWGMDVRVGASGAAQTADVIINSTTGGDPTVLTGYTGVASVEASVAFWVGHAYLAGQWTRYWAGGRDQADLAHELNGSETLSISAIVAIQVGGENEPPRPVFLQFGGTGKPDFSDTIWTFKLAMTFDPL